MTKEQATELLLSYITNSENEVTKVVLDEYIQEVEFSLDEELKEEINRMCSLDLDKVNFFDGTWFVGDWSSARERVEELKEN